MILQMLNRFIQGEQSSFDDLGVHHGSSSPHLPGHAPRRIPEQSSMRPFVVIAACHVRFEPNPLAFVPRQNTNAVPDGTKGHSARCPCEVDNIDALPHRTQRISQDGNHPKLGPGAACLVQPGVEVDGDIEITAT